MIGIQANIEGEKKINALLENINVKLNDLKEPISESIDYMEDQVQENFKSEGGKITNKWQALNPAYAEAKKKRYGNKPILEATGKMKNSFKKLSTSTYGRIWNSTSYFKYHQSNKSRSKLPRRPMLNIKRANQTEIYKIFNKYINKIKNG